MVAHEINPLFVDLVLDRVFHFLSEEDLKSCRLVCIKWLSPATKALQRHSSPIIFGCLCKINLVRIRPDLDTIQQFTSTMSSSSFKDLRRDLPFVKFDFRPYLFSSPHIHLLNNFLNQFGTAIQSIIVQLAFESADDFPSECFSSLELSSLKSLEFHNSLHGDNRPSLTSSLYTRRKNLLQWLLQASPSLESLSLWCDRENIIWPAEVAAILRDMKLRRLETLKISFPMSPECLSSLSGMSAQLTTLIFVIREPLFDQTLFKQFLDSQRNSLRTLRIVDLQCSSFKIIEFPRILPYLEKLEIEGTFYGDESMMTFANFSYRKFPRLKRIILNSCNKRNFDLNGLLYTSDYRGTVCPTLEEFQFSLDHDSNDQSGNCIRRIKEVYPNLRQLSVIFTAESKKVLTSLFEHLTKLQELVINVRKCVECIDSVLTGIPSNIQEHLIRKGAYRHGPISLDPRLLAPGITNLKDLKSLELVGEKCTNTQGNRGNGSSQFTEFSVYMGFLKMNRLRKLTFRHTGNHLPPAVINKIKASLDFVHIPA